MKIQSNFKRDPNPEIISAFSTGDEKNLKKSTELPKDYFESLTDKVYYY